MWVVKYLLQVKPFSDGKISAIRLIALDRKEAEEFYEVYRNVVPEYSQMVSVKVPTVSDGNF